MEAFLGHIYAFAEIYSVLLCWLVVPLVYAAAYFYFVRNLPVSFSESAQAKPEVVAEAAPVEAAETKDTVDEVPANVGDEAEAPAVEGAVETESPAEALPEVQAQTEESPEAKVANG